MTIQAQATGNRSAAHSHSKPPTSDLQPPTPPPRNRASLPIVEFVVLPPVHDRESETLEETKTEVEEPDMFRVVLHNDDFTTMEFVVHVLMTIFRHPEQVAIRVMLEVHNQGSGIAGTYTREIATTKVAETSELARQWEYPLLCTMERL